MRERIRFESELSELGLAEFDSAPTNLRTKWLKLFPDAKRNNAEFLLDGEAYYQSVIQAIKSAKKKGDYIYILGWMLDIDLQLVKGDPDSTLFKILGKISKDVEIRILIWDNPTHSYANLHKSVVPRLNALPNTKIHLDTHNFSPPQATQLMGKIVPYIKFFLQKYAHHINPVSKWLEENHDVPASYYLLLLLNVTGILQIGGARTIGAHHDKVVIVKGSEGLTAFCGGIDFNENRVISTIEKTTPTGTVKMKSRFPYYHDNACRLQGPAAFDVLQRFIRRWKNHPVAGKTILLGAKERKPNRMPAPHPCVKVVGTYNSPDGKIKDRSLKEAYFKIIENAEEYIYIEDQYLVNLDVADALNKKIKEPRFQKLTFAIQDSIETSDILIPNRKRGEFYDAVINGATQSQKEKVLLAVIDRTNWSKSSYHPGLHAKTLIVDDEIAIIGSANVNQRSFTCDSETSAIVFNDWKYKDQNFARQLRIASWKEFLRKPAPAITYESWWNYPTEISGGKRDFSILVKYTQHAQDDRDLKIWKEIDRFGVAGVVAAYKLLAPDLPTAQQLMFQGGIEGIFNIIWDSVIDPNCR